MAHSLAVALENFHRIGWIHKHIQKRKKSCSPNPHEGVIVPAGDVDLAAPWLFGFKYTRATDAGAKLEADFLLTNNVYRHPDRWNMPEKKFTEHHDVYSLVNMFTPYAIRHIHLTYYRVWYSSRLPHGKAFIPITSRAVLQDKWF